VAVTAPSVDIYGAQIDAAIATAQALVNATPTSSIVYPQYVQLLNQLQVSAVEHYMVTGWLSAVVILETYQPNSRDATGQTLLARVVFLQNLFNNAPAPPPGNAEGYGGAGWVTVAQNYAVALYAAQITLVEHLMRSTVYGTSAAIMLANLTGFQSFPFEYVFNSVGYTDAWTDD
jgi:hypothetical protein